MVEEWKEQPTLETERALVIARAKELGLVPDDSPAFDSVEAAMEYLEDESHPDWGSLDLTLRLANHEVTEPRKWPRFGFILFKSEFMMNLCCS